MLLEQWADLKGRGTQQSACPRTGTVTLREGGTGGPPYGCAVHAGERRCPLRDTIAGI